MKIFNTILLLVAITWCSPFPHCHWVTSEDVWKQKVFSCAVTSPRSLDDEPFRFKLSMYIESTRGIFKDRFRYKIVGGNGVGGLRSPNRWVTRPPAVAEWFTCKRVLIKTNPEKPESPSIEGAYCPIAAYIQNRNFLANAKLGMMFHIDDHDVRYEIPPPELFNLTEAQKHQVHRPSPTSRAFKLVTSILLGILVVSSVVVIGGIFIARVLSKFFVDQKKKKKSLRTDRQRIAASLRKAERIRQKKRELGLPANQDLDKKLLDELSSSSGDDESGEEEEDDDDDRDESNAGFVSDKNLLLSRMGDARRPRLYQSGPTKGIRSNQLTSAPKTRIGATKQSIRPSTSDSKATSSITIHKPVMVGQSVTSAPTASRQRIIGVTQSNQQSSQIDKVGNDKDITYDQVERDMESRMLKRLEEEEERKRILWGTKPGQAVNTNQYTTNNADIIRPRNVKPGPDQAPLIVEDESSEEQ